ncbi:RNA polymerase I-specific transcription initiation factor RRN3 isoform X2 [Hyalella azteca]|uniref:RNA polymerase I-specific transcription initiation factor RRN3 isoform X2 n=1 Tax=Hyalella azteca TaxID=294128 RepID=A0A8B7P7F3_HYAAZ|nr:RNA polymerase I-specific transcription initiation factor RRN3 isoform X2 [Hyalella azteca]
MLVNNPPRTPPILKKRERNCAALPGVDPNDERVPLLLERVRETGLVSSYAAELEEISSATAEDQLEWVVQFTHNVIRLDTSTSGFIVEVLKLPWKLTESDMLQKAYQNFVVALVTAHNIHCKAVFSHLFGLLLPDTSMGAEMNEADQLLLVNPQLVPKSTMQVTQCSIEAIVMIHAKVPLSERTLLREASNARPYYKRHPHLLLIYCKCLLILSSRIPSLRKTFLEMIVERLVDIDANCPREPADGSDDENEEEEVFKMDVDEELSQSQNSLIDVQRKARLDWILNNPLMHSLDVLMDAMVLYIHCTVHDVPFSLDRNINIEELRILGCLPGSVKLAPNLEADQDSHDSSTDTSHKQQLTLGCACGGEKHNLMSLKRLYHDLVGVFTRIVLPTHSSGHVQFFMFYVLSIKPSLTRIFLDTLRTDSFMGNGVALDVKKNALAYIGSLMVRGKFVPISTTLSCLEVIVSWCHEYINSQEKQGTNNYMNLALHEKFYCACQTIFYVFSFRCLEFTKSEKMLDHVRRLNLERLVFSKLNPLAVCRYQIVKNFAAITRHFQLAYCYAIIESNRRNTLPVCMHASDGSDVRASAYGSSLDMAFPFDPYQLLHSAPYFEAHYQHFPGLPEYISMDAEERILEKEETEDEDDFLDHSYPSDSYPKISSFMECQDSPTAERKTLKRIFP